MKNVLICGMSGVGKTTIVKNLYEQYKDKYNVVCSYTDREKREKDEWGHTFIDSSFMDYLLERDDIVARTKIGKHRYCCTSSQFSEEKVNLYITDVNGVNDTINRFPTSEIMIVLIRRREIEVDCVRVNRDVLVPDRDSVHFVIPNNVNIESPVNLLNALVNFDLFNKPSHVTTTISDRLDEVDERFRLLGEIKVSLCEQLFYQEKPHYDALCEYVQDKLNKDFDFQVTIGKDSAPDIYDDDLTFNIIIKHHQDLMWDEINRLIEKGTMYAYSFCKENNLDEISYRLHVSEYWVDEK